MSWTGLTLCCIRNFGIKTQIHFTQQLLRVRVVNSTLRKCKDQTRCPISRVTRNKLCECKQLKKCSRPILTYFACIQVVYLVEESIFITYRHFCTWAKTLIPTKIKLRFFPYRLIFKVCYSITRGKLSWITLR